MLYLSAAPVLMGVARVPVAGAFMPTAPPKAIGGTCESIFDRILTPFRGRSTVRLQYPAAYGCLILR